VQRDGGKHEGQAAGEPHAARDRVSELRRGAVARIEVGRGRQHADDRAIEHVVGEARPFEKPAPQEQREFFVAILGETGPQTTLHRHSPSTDSTDSIVVVVLDTGRSSKHRSIS